VHSTSQCIYSRIHRCYLYNSCPASLAVAHKTRNVPSLPFSLLLEMIVTSVAWRCPTKGLGCCCCPKKGLGCCCCPTKGLGCCCCPKKGLGCFYCPKKGLGCCCCPKKGLGCCCCPKKGLGCCCWWRSALLYCPQGTSEPWVKSNRHVTLFTSNPLFHARTPHSLLYPPPSPPYFFIFIFIFIFLGFCVVCC
jgi:hypothetical protein